MENFPGTNPGKPSSGGGVGGLLHGPVFLVEHFSRGQFSLWSIFRGLIFLVEHFSRD